VRWIEQPQSGDHQPIGLTGKGRGENGVALGISRELLSK
jgi:hypothetical protein